MQSIPEKFGCEVNLLSFAFLADSDLYIRFRVEEVVFMPSLLNVEVGDSPHLELCRFWQCSQQFVEDLVEGLVKLIYHTWVTLNPAQRMRMIFVWPVAWSVPSQKPMAVVAASHCLRMSFGWPWPLPII